MKQRLIVRQESPDSWCVSGEGMHFYMSCSDREAALFVAHITKRDWYPRARVVVEDIDHEVTTAAILREERFQRAEWRDTMMSDWNE